MTGVLAVPVAHAKILDGFAALLGSTSPFTYRADDSQYLPTETAITFGELTPTGPCVSLTVYDEEELDWSSVRYFVQARIRTSGDPYDLAVVDAVRNVLAWRRHPPMPAGIDVVQIRPVSFARLGRVGDAHIYTRNFSALT